MRELWEAYERAMNGEALSPVSFAINYRTYSMIASFSNNGQVVSGTNIISQESSITGWSLKLTGDSVEFEGPKASLALGRRPVVCCVFVLLCAHACVHFS